MPSVSDDAAAARTTKATARTDSAAPARTVPRRPGGLRRARARLRACLRRTAGVPSGRIVPVGQTVVPSARSPGASVCSPKPAASARGGPRNVGRTGNADLASSISSTAEPGRSSASLARPVRITSSSSGDNAGSNARADGIGSRMCAYMTATALSRTYGTRPVMHSNRTAASE